VQYKHFGDVNILFLYHWCLARLFPVWEVAALEASRRPCLALLWRVCWYTRVESGSVSRIQSSR
jgi:hypothetical protein